MSSLIDLASTRISNARENCKFIKNVMFDKIFPILSNNDVYNAVFNIDHAFMPLKPSPTYYGPTVPHGIICRFAKYRGRGWSLTSLDIAGRTNTVNWSSDTAPVATDDTLEHQTIVLYEMALYGLVKPFMDHFNDYSRIDDSAYATLIFPTKHGEETIVTFDETRKNRVTTYSFCVDGSMSYTSVRPMQSANIENGVEIAASFKFDENFDVIEDSFIHYLNDIKFTEELFEAWKSYDDISEYFRELVIYKGGETQDFRLTAMKSDNAYNLMVRFFTFLLNSDIDLNDMEENDLINISMAFPKK